MSDLADRECVPCRGGVPPLPRERVEALLAELGGGWEAVDGARLERLYRFPNFRAALDFTVRVGELAEKVNHHPDVQLGWGKVKLILFTHKIGGLTETDFVFAAKADRLA
jgi:4a-hydroxytetrahydrobiopterin dehydratase